MYVFICMFVHVCLCVCMCACASGCLITQNIYKGGVNVSGLEHGRKLKLRVNDINKKTLIFSNTGESINTGKKNEQQRFHITFSSSLI